MNARTRKVAAPLVQPSLFGERTGVAVPAITVRAHSQVVNVASVPQRSPFRYPGGKTWLVPRIRLWLRSLPTRPNELVEPFAGGAIVGLTAVAEDLVQKATLIELDEDVAAVWEAILYLDATRLTDLIAAFHPTVEAVRAVLSTPARTPYEQAFATIVKNRVQRGGILAPGASLMKLGENGRGVASRWYPETLCRRIEAIAALKHRISFLRCDGIEYMGMASQRADAVFFIDPPYTVAGRRLYKYSAIDHHKLFEVATHLVGDFLMTYDNVSEIRWLAREFGLDTEEVPMKNTHNAEKTELLVGRDLSWARPVTASRDAQACCESASQRYPG